MLQIQTECTYGGEEVGGARGVKTEEVKYDEIENAVANSNKLS